MKGQGMKRDMAAPKLARKTLETRLHSEFPKCSLPIGARPWKSSGMAGRTRLIKLGKRLAVGEIAVQSEGAEQLVAHATATYSIPDSG